MAKKKNELLEEEVVEKVEEIAEETVAETEVVDSVDEITAGEEIENSVEPDDLDTSGEEAESVEPEAELEVTEEVESEDAVVVEAATKLEKTEEGGYVLTPIEKIESGVSIILDLAPIFKTAVCKKPHKFLCGEFYIVDGIISCDRVRVANDVEGNDVLGWVNVDSVQSK